MTHNKNRYIVYLCSPDMIHVRFSGLQCLIKRWNCNEIWRKIVRIRIDLCTCWKSLVYDKRW